ncbi:hypothetical protein [Aeromonas diversa]|uniref:Uncharacterized protein n=1 Tax=Aeromonas diversa CDC 2478-85 TaxID=1268237 RepID=N9U0I1_9GAMM|nr:hypothetical protein [Aeromonas diversa]ENY71884.1 hypothetical protein G114_10755 [Aeromonas diversa CDC 2478-85]
MFRFEVFNQDGQCWAHDLNALRNQVMGREGEVMVRYINRLGQSCTLFLMVQSGRVFQRFKHGQPELDWHWLARSMHDELRPIHRHMMQII